MNIVFVCAGNICRSATAELVMNRLLADAGRTDVKVWSAGMWADVGHEMDRGSRERAEQDGLDGSQHVGRQFELEWLQTADLVVVFDRWAGQQLRRDARANFEDSLEKIRIVPLMNPWRHHPVIYDRVHRRIEQICKELLAELV